MIGVTFGNFHLKIRWFFDSATRRAATWKPPQPERGNQWLEPKLCMTLEGFLSPKNWSFLSYTFWPGLRPGHALRHVQAKQKKDNGFFHSRFALCVFHPSAPNTLLGSVFRYPKATPKPRQQKGAVSIRAKQFQTKPWFSRLIWRWRSLFPPLRRCQIFLGELPGFHHRLQWERGAPPAVNSHDISIYNWGWETHQPKSVGVKIYPL